jgi:GT2 family glycosyltransferase
MSPQNPGVRVIIVTYQSACYINACLDSLLAQDYPNFRITLVDNGSTDSIFKELEKYGNRLDVINAGRNLGFPKAVNLALQHCTEEIVALLNPDTEMKPNWLSQLIKGLCETPDTGIAGSLLLFPDEHIQHIGGKVHANGLTEHLCAGEPSDDIEPESRQVDYATGAALAIRLSHLQDMGGLDEGYPLYGEDVQLATDIARMGLKTIIFTGASGIHHESVGSRKESFLYLYRLHRARLRYVFLNLPLSHLLRRWPGEEWYFLRIAGMFTTYRIFPVATAYLTLILRLPWLYLLRRGKKYQIAKPELYGAYIGKICNSSMREYVREWRKRNQPEDADA